MPTDQDFIRALVHLTDQSPNTRVAGSDIAAAIDMPADEVEPTVQRLKARGYLDFAPGPRRMSDGWSSTSLSVTPEGYRWADTRESR